jgi:hypothetical protein
MDACRKAQYGKSDVASPRPRDSLDPLSHHPKIRGDLVRDRYRFMVELFASGAGAICFALTLIRRDWIEAVFDVDPDAGSGALEWVIAGVFLAIALTFGLMARRQWRQLAMGG